MANNKPKDIILTCAKCGSRFYFTVGEQQFYKSKGLNIPKYCKNCRANKREEIVRKQERREAWVPKACSTCYFCCSREEWVIGKGYDDVYYCTRNNSEIINDAPCKYWTKDRK